MDKIKIVEELIFNDEFQKELAEINNSLMDFNILEITGMGHQETKHSNILGWLFEDSEHNLEYQILDGFLKQVIEANKDNDNLNKLQKYLYLSRNRNITVYREKDNIDLLIEDKENKFIIVIENKVWAEERKDGKDGGQLKKYEIIINNKYSKSYTKFFIFLTPDLAKPSEGNEKWMLANYQMILNTINSIIDSDKDLNIKTKLILESYVDLLKRRNIVEDKKLKELCEKIWGNKKYKKALDVLFEYKPDKQLMIYEYLEQKIKNNNKIISTTNCNNLRNSSKAFIRFISKDFDCKDGFRYEINNEPKKTLKLGFLLIKADPKAEFIFKKFKKSIIKKNNIEKLKYNETQIDKLVLVEAKDIKKFEKEELSFEEIKEKIDEKWDAFFKEDGKFEQIEQILSELKD